MDLPVVIAGGGPTGLMLACELALGGVPAVVIEPRTEAPDGVSEGMTVHGRTLDLLAHRGLSERIEVPLLLRWPRTPFSLMWLDMSAADDHEYTFMYPQWRVERLLEQRAVELGVDVRRGHRITGLHQDDAGVTVVVEGPVGRQELRTPYLVGCDGPDSTVRTAAGIGLQTLGRTYYGVFGDMEPAKDADKVFDSGVFERGMFGAVPITADLVRLMTIEFDVPRPPDDVPVTEDELVARIRHITGKTPRLGRIRWVSRYGRPTVLAERYRAGRVLLAGDAAHSFFISGTHGLNAGLHDAANLGWKLAAVLLDGAPPVLLDSYERERRPVGHRLCRHASAVMALADPIEQIGPLREFVGQLLAFGSVNQHLLRMTTAVHYPIGAEDDQLAGRPLPDLDPSVDLTRLPLREGRGVLFDLSDGGADLDPLEPWRDRIGVVRAKRPADLDAELVLVRPDGIVAWSGRPGAGRDGLDAALRTWFGERG